MQSSAYHIVSTPYGCCVSPVGLRAKLGLLEIIIIILLPSGVPDFRFPAYIINELVRRPCSVLGDADAPTTSKI